METRKIGATGLHVTTLGVGGAPLGNDVADHEEDLAISAVQRSYESGIKYFDTAPIYGLGRSERRIGRALAGIPREQFVISTKVGRLLEPCSEGSGSAEPEVVFDWTRDGVIRSIEESLQRLAMDRVDIALLHGPQDYYEAAIGEAYPALADLRSQGVVTAIGAGMNDWETPARFAREGDFDCFLIAGRYTLLDQTALAELLPLCQEKGISVILGGPYNSGILASDLSPEATYQYAKAPDDILDRARRIGSVCKRYGVPLNAAALQFGLAHPAVASSIPGVRNSSEVDDNVRAASHPVPNALWEDLKRQGLLDQSAPVPIGTS